jgi:hypothetical protein
MKKSFYFQIKVTLLYEISLIQQIPANHPCV